MRWIIWKKYIVALTVPPCESVPIGMSPAMGVSLVGADVLLLLPLTA